MALHALVHTSYSLFAAVSAISGAAVKAVLHAYNTLPSTTAQRAATCR